MSSNYQRVLDLLDELTATELTALIAHVSKQLQKHIGEVEQESEDTETDGSRRYLPRLPQMIDWGIVVPIEDKLYVKDQSGEPALLLDANRVAYRGETLSINDWAKKITGWKSVNVYEWVVVERTGDVLDNMRRQYMEENDL